MKLIKYILIILSVLLINSCEDWLETNPKDSLPGDKILSTLSGNEGLLLGAYDIMQGTSLYGRTMICVPEILADNCGMSQGGYMYRNEYRNRIGAHIEIWTYAYSIIAITNDIIAAVDNIAVEGEDVKTRDRIKGEALFLRGLFYFDLLRTYSREPGHLVNNFDLGVPHVTEPFIDMGPHAYPERADIYTIWAQVEKDLGDAFSLLDGNDGSNFPQRANSYATKSLLARAYLYQSKWKEAFDAADWVIKSGKIALHNGDYKEIYTSSAESIFELRYTAPEALGASSLHALYATVDDGYRDAEGYGNGKGSGEGELIIAENLRTQFENGDKRLTVMRKAYFGSNKVWWTTKFNSWQGTFGQDNIPIIRIAELYLIRAEANLNQSSPNFDLARADINDIRQKRGLGDTPANNQSLMAALDKERRLELCFEGHRFYDLKRKGLNITKEAPSTTLPYTDFKVVAGIPQTEMDVNSSLVNNPGY